MKKMCFVFIVMIILLMTSCGKKDITYNGVVSAKNHYPAQRLGLLLGYRDVPEAWKLTIKYHAKGSEIKRIIEVDSEKFESLNVGDKYILGESEGDKLLRIMT